MRPSGKVQDLAMLFNDARALELATKMSCWAMTLMTLSLPPATGALTYQTAKDVNNLTGNNLVVLVTLTDTGANGSGNVNSTTKAFTLNITPVNDEPLFTLPATTVTVFEDNESVIGAAKTQSRLV